MAVTSKRPQRKTLANQDLGAIESIVYNDAAGAKKFIQIEPVVKRAVTGAENVGAGKYIKVTGTSYTLDLVGRAYDANATYQKGDVVTQAGSVWKCEKDQVTGTFDAINWTEVSAKQIGPVTITAGAVVCTGRWHNTVSVDGFLVEDDSDIPFIRVRD